MTEPALGTGTTEAAHATVPVIEERGGYLDAVERIADGHGPVAVDAERASGYRYSQRAYLIQIYRRGAGTFLFDPPAIGEFTELNDAIHDEEWLLHAASQDLACLREVGLDPIRLYDTELAARLAGLPRVGLGTVVEELLGIHLAKEHSAVDWSTRPLPDSWLVYAALDVELLPDLRDKLAELLSHDGKAAFAEQEFAALLAKGAPPPRADPWRRLSGIHSVRGPRNLAVARELWLARDRYAREIDTAPGRLVPDSALVHAARALPSSKRELAGMKEFNGRASRSQLDRWWDAIEAGRTTEDLPTAQSGGDGLPPPRTWADKNPEADRRLRAARGAVTELSEQLAIPLENLLTPDFLRRVAWSPPDPADADGVGRALRELGAREWQIGLTAQQIADAFVASTQTDEDASEPAS